MHLGYISNPQRKRGKSFYVQTRKNDLNKALDLEFENLIDPQTCLISEKFLEERDCPVCHIKRQVYLFTKQGFRYVRCPKCGLIFINPQLKTKVLKKMYTCGIFNRIFIDKVLSSRTQRQFDTRKFTDVINELIPLLPPAPLVIDVGCANGLFLQLCQGMGFRCMGIEPSEYAVHYVRSTTNLKILFSTWEEAEISAETADLITFWASLSYLKEPVRGLEKAYEILKAGGILLMLVDGNPHSLIMRILRERCVGFEFMRLWYFAPPVMVRVIEKLGFDIIKVESIINHLEPILNYISYTDPYSGQKRDPLFTEEEILFMETFIKKKCMGYKYFIYAKKP